MAWKVSKYLRFCAVACLAVFGLAASEHHGVVKFGSVPVPGATVTAMQEDKKAVAVTDMTGAYSFPDLADGVWKIQVEMLCFATATKEVGVAPNAPGAEWELKLLSLDEIKPGKPAPAGTPATASATAPGTAPGTNQGTASAAQGAAAATPSIIAANGGANRAANGAANAAANPPAKGAKKGKGAAAASASPQ